MPNGSDAYYDQLFGPEAGQGAGGILKGKPSLKGIQESLSRGMQSPLAKGIGGSLFFDWLLNQVMGGIHGRGMRGIQRAGLRSQAEMITPENLYYQAALPQAQEEEAMAHQALMQQISGGVLGPSLAKGEYRIGG
uniref:Uncharacterized protein n=1 Tax=viral metagenome TaxID=1070528 RepID=A0A6M3J8J6_9ZZZZ